MANRYSCFLQGSKLGQDGVFCYDPQSRPIYELRIPPHDATKIFSSSYDGTLKCGDLCAGVFSQVRDRFRVWSAGLDAIFEKRKKNIRNSFLWITKFSAQEHKVRCVVCAA